MPIVWPLFRGVDDWVENFPEMKAAPSAMSSNEAVSASAGRARCVHEDLRCIGNSDRDGVGHAGQGSGMDERKKSRRSTSFRLTEIGSPVYLVTDCIAIGAGVCAAEVASVVAAVFAC